VKAGRRTVHIERDGLVEQVSHDRVTYAPQPEQETPHSRLTSNGASAPAVGTDDQTANTVPSMAEECLHRDASSPQRVSLPTEQPPGHPVTKPLSSRSAVEGEPLTDIPSIGPRRTVFEEGAQADIHRQDNAASQPMSTQLDLPEDETIEKMQEPASQDANKTFSRLRRSTQKEPTGTSPKKNSRPHRQARSRQHGMEISQEATSAEPLNPTGDTANTGRRRRSSSQDVPTEQGAISQNLEPPEEQEFAIDDLIDYVVDDDKEEWFLVKWYGYRDPTWTQRHNVPDEQISRYFRKVDRQAGKKTSKRRTARRRGK